MFQKMKNIDTAFRHVRGFSMLIITCCFLLSAFAIYTSYTMVTEAQDRIYLLVNGKALEAISAGRKDNIPVEARDHITTFHQFFFTLDPDDKVIQANLTRALYLADGSAKREYDNLKENGYYSGIIAGNISQQITVDSIQLNMDSHPYRFRCFATQNLVRATSTVYRLLVTEGRLRNVSKSDNNPHGFLIERWATVENRDIKIQNRQ
ncbi:conjugative transposon protein TraK [Pedobacter sp. UBA4863]|uniref:conjugative transposon protein TraK n=1 Tax=Pedobacter sp. UBA4863 TaxID=1947060 RepID=UPI0025CFAFCB|nr:conjugative transposon protein TraK [Pedobacter sp. UBA4863]